MRHAIKNIKSEDRALAIGLLSQSFGENEKDPLFLFINCMLMDVLKPINIAVKSLKASDEKYATNEDKWDKMVKKIKSDNEQDQAVRPRRTLTIPSHFNDFVVTEPIPSENTEQSRVQIFTECLDLVNSEFTRRFSTENIILWDAMSALSPASDSFLDYNALKPLYEYAKKIPFMRDFYNKETLSTEDLEAECRIFARISKNKDWPKHKNGKYNLGEIGQMIMKDHKDGAPVLTSLYKVAITAGFTSTRVECVFSSLTRIDTPQRRSMNTTKECDLAYLAFKSDILMKYISFEDFYQRWISKPR